MEKRLFIINGEELIEVHAVTSDTHFGHRNIAKYTGRPFDNAENTYHMDSTLAANWNAVVSEDETVLHLGDAALGKVAESLKWFSKTNGRTALIPGNHDEVALASRTSNARRERTRDAYKEAFEWILPESGVELQVILGNRIRRIQASHYPSFGDSHDKGTTDRYAQWRPNPALGPILHGHTHSLDKFQADFPLEFHVGVEAHNLAPVRAEVIVDWVFSLE